LVVKEAFVDHSTILDLHCTLPREFSLEIGEPTTLQTPKEQKPVLLPV
jgi:hypothetical protein